MSTGEVITLRDDCVRVAKKIQKLLVKKKLGCDFEEGSEGYSRIRSCCSWIIEKKPERTVFVDHLSQVLFSKNRNRNSTRLSNELKGLLLVRTPILDPEAVQVPLRAKEKARR